MRTVGLWGLAVMAVAMAGCGFSPSGAAGDGGHPNDTPIAIDGHAGSGSDAGTGRDGGLAAPRVARDLVLGAGRISVGAITADVQLGAGPQATHLAAGTVSIDGQPVVTP